MNKSYRIKIDPSTETTNQIKLKLEQDVETLEFLTMSIDTKEFYNNFNADYGVLVGRVIANGGVGVPNAKVSIFIPLADEDVNNQNIISIYPYKSPYDKNREGKRYNLLPRTAEINENGGVSPKQPFGSFPIKPELITNSKYLNVYKKYYKYTATTNETGDYMIFGVPVGTQTVHMSVDITDIGEYSMNPAAMVTNLGYSPNLFTDNNTRIKGSNDLDDLPHIETQEITVDVIPFWGDVENFEIGITQQNFRIRATLTTTFTIFGSVFTDGDNAMFGRNSYTGARRISELYSAREDDIDTVGMATKRIGNINEKIYYYPANFTEFEITGSTFFGGGTADPRKDMLILDKSEYTAFKRDGDFVFIINCNRNKIFKNELGQEVSVSSDSDVGVFTEFRGFIVIEYTEDEIPMTFTGEIGTDTTVTPFRYRLKFPQFAGRNQGFNLNEDHPSTQVWRKQTYLFKYNKFYSLSRFHPLTYNSTENSDGDQFGLDNGFFQETVINDLTKFRSGTTQKPLNNIGIIVTSSHKPEGSSAETEFRYPNAFYEFPSNGGINAKLNADDDSNEYIRLFGANWMNLSVYLPQLGYLTRGRTHVRDVYTADHFGIQFEDSNSTNRYFLFDNTQSIAAGDFNTKFIARSDLNWTDIIEVPEQDIRLLQRVDAKGFDSNVFTGDTALIGEYRNGSNIPNHWTIGQPCPIDGGKLDGNPINDTDPKTYFYKGFETANCIDYLFELGLIT